MTRARDVSNIDGILTTKGDIYAATAAATPDRLGVGTNGQVLTAASGQATGLQWATPSSGGMTLLSTTTASGSSTSISITSTGYNSLYINIYGISSSSASEITLKLNSDSTANYSRAVSGRDGGGTATLAAGSGVGYLTLTNAITCQASNTENSTQITIFDPTNTSSYPKNILSFSTTFNASGARQFYQTLGSKITVGAITSIQIETTAGSWNNGTIQVYGVK
jgi:hypothetical protein